MGRITALFPPASHRAILLAACLAASAPVGAQKKAGPPAPDDPTSGRDPAAIALRDRMVRAYRDLRGIHEKITQRTWKSSPEDALRMEIELRFRKPNLLYLSIDYPYIDKPGRWQLIYACNGKTLTVYNGARNEYQTAKAPPRLDRLVLPQALRGPEFPLLLRETARFDDLDKSAIVKYTEIYQDASPGPRYTLKIDIQQDGARRTLRYRIDPRDRLVRGLSLTIDPDSSPVSAFADPEIRSTVEADYVLVEANPRFSDADFSFTPPAGAKEQQTKDARPAGSKGARRHLPSSDRQ